MKNIHILSTNKRIKDVGDLVKDQYSNIYIFTKNDGREYGKTTTKLNIYITNSEEIKEGDFQIDSKNRINKFSSVSMNLLGETYQKVILTTDQDLIKDGVQAIDDEFLCWFVKNPSCEEVEIYEVNGRLFAEPIIPKEESKCTCKEHDPYCCQFHGSCPTCVKKEEPNQEIDLSKYIIGFDPYNKQETLEKAAEKFYPLITTDLICSPKLVRSGFIAGAKWQQEKSYSYIEEYANYCLMCSAEKTLKIPLQPKEWLEQLKKIKK